MPRPQPRVPANIASLPATVLARQARPRPNEGLLGIVLSTPLLTAILLVLTWPIDTITPSTGLDPSWQAGLYMAVEGGLQFGREIVFTYGPLGFLHSPVLYGEATWLISFAYSTLVRVALTVSLLWVARRALPLPLALASCFVVLIVAPINAAVVLIAFIWCFVAAGKEPPAFAAPLITYGGGALAALELLGKVNFGLSILVLCVVALAAGAGRRASLPRFAAVFVVTLLGLWLLSGQSISNLPGYGANSIQFLSGYARTMGTNIGTLPWEIPLALGAIAILFAGVVATTLGGGRRVRIASLLLFATFAYLSFKQDFVRRGPEGRTEFALLMAAASLAIAARLPRRDGLTLPPLARSAALVAPLLALVVWALPTASFWTSLEPDLHVVALREDARVFFSPSARHTIRSQARAAMRGDYGLPATITKRIADRPVAIEPWEIGVAWAYQLNWEPLPVIQDYAAYTAGLDQLDATALAGAGPATIIRQEVRGEFARNGNSDGRFPAWSSPASKLALLCNYRAAITTTRWQLLEAGDSRCGVPRRIGAVQTETGTPIPAPSPPGPDEIVFARIHGLGLTPIESAQSLLYRAPGRTVSFDGGAAWHLAYTTLGDGLILRAPTAVDFPRPFQLAPDARFFSLGVDGSGKRPVNVEFFAQRINH